jgi:hypothetical protein
MGQTIAEAIWEEGWLKGETAGARRVLRAYLTARFGQLLDPIVQRIESCTDLDRLTAAVQQVANLDKPEDLQL